MAPFLGRRTWEPQRRRPSVPCPQAHTVQVQLAGHLLCADRVPASWPSQGHGGGGGGGELLIAGCRLSSPQRHCSPLPPAWGGEQVWLQGLLPPAGAPRVLSVTRPLLAALGGVQAAGGVLGPWACCPLMAASGISPVSRVVNSAAEGLTDSRSAGRAEGPKCHPAVLPSAPSCSTCTPGSGPSSSCTGQS